MRFFPRQNLSVICCAGGSWKDVTGTLLASDWRPGLQVVSQVVMFFCRFPKNCICTHATRSRPPKHELCAHDAAVACGRMPRRNNLPALQRSDGPQSIPRPTRQKSKTLQVELDRTPQPTRNMQRTDATKSHCCRRTKSSVIGTPLTITPLARDTQHF